MFGLLCMRDHLPKFGFPYSHQVRGELRVQEIIYSCQPSVARLRLNTTERYTTAETPLMSMENFIRVEE
jgi:hypothetical protein